MMTVDATECFLIRLRKDKHCENTRICYPLVVSIGVSIEKWDINYFDKFNNVIENNILNRCIIKTFQTIYITKLL